MADETTTTTTIGALTSRDLNALVNESEQLDMSPTRGFQDFLVELPETSDFPFELVHTLNSSDPYGVRYEVLQAPFPVVIYHDPADTWAPGLVILRSTSKGGNIRIRLTVDDGDATQIEANTADELEFLVKGKVGSTESNTVSQNAVSQVGLVGSSTMTWDSFRGPGINLKDANAEWSIGLNANQGPSDHSINFAHMGAGVVPFRMRRKSGDYFFVPGGQTNAAYTVALGAPSSIQSAGFWDIAYINGIQFPATQVASADPNNLDDYEEGACTPVIVSTGGGTPTYNNNSGFYTKVGNKIKVIGNINLSGFGTLAAGTLTIQGLPFTVNPGVHGSCVFPYWGVFTTAMSSFHGLAFANTTSIALLYTAAGGGTFGTNPVTKADIAAACDMWFVVTYFV